MTSQKRLSILLDCERKDLYGVPQYTLEEKRVYFSLNDFEADYVGAIRSRSHRCFFIALLGYFKTKPVVLSPSYGEVESDLQFIEQEYYSGFKFKRFNLTQKQKDRFYSKIFDLLKHTAWSNDLHRSMSLDHLYKTTRHCMEPRYIFDDFIDYLSQKHIAIPKYTVLQNIVSSAINYEKRRIMISLEESMTGVLGDELIKLVAGKGILPMSRLRCAAKSFKAVELQKELNIYHLIRPWINKINLTISLLSLSLKNKEYFASLVDYYSITKIKRFDRITQQLYLLCYLQVRYQRTIERLADGFVYHVRRLRERSKVYAKEASYRDLKEVSGNIGKAAKILSYFIDDSIDDQQSFESIKNKAQKLLKKDDIKLMCLYLSKQNRSLNDHRWEFYDNNSNTIGRLLRQIFLCFSFKGIKENNLLALQIHSSQADLLSDGRITTMDKRLIYTHNKKHLVSIDGVVNESRYEMLIYLMILGKLDDDLYISTSIKYRSLNDDLIDSSAWKNKRIIIKQSMLKRLNTRPKKVMSTMVKKYDDMLCRVNRSIRDNCSDSPMKESHAGKTKWRLPSSSKTTALNNPFFQQINPVNITDLLCIVNRETGFIGHFNHVRQVGSISITKFNDLMAVIIGNGTNYGLYGMASISDRSYERLRNVQANYLRPETLRLANDAINNATERLIIFKHYNIQKDKVHASVDGQKFESRLETFKTRYSSKYFGTNKGVSSLTLVANHAPLNALIIGSNEHESHYIFDLLYSNTSEIQPDVLSTDTHGVNHVNFALLDLFSYKFAPRYANFGKVIEDLFTIKHCKGSSGQLSLKKQINTKLIIEQWDTIQRIAISLQQKTVTQATLVRKLSRYNKKHPLLKALYEYNRMLKATYILEYIDNESLRGYVQRALNRGEAYHQLRRAIASVNGNRFRGFSDYEINLWNECARLLTSAIIYFNSLILSHLMKHFESTGNLAKLKITQKVSPVAWLNINLNGSYSFNFESKLPTLDEIMNQIVKKA